jgi:hypothetical protein
VELSGETTERIFPSEPPSVISGYLLLRLTETFVFDPDEHEVIRLIPEISTIPNNNFMVSIELTLRFRKG